MMKVALIDYKHPKAGFANRDQTGIWLWNECPRFLGKAIAILKRDKVRIPVLQLAYLNAIAREEGHEVAIYNGMPQGEDIIIVASSMLHSSYELEFTETLKKDNPSSIVGFVGPFSSEKPDLYLSKGDFVIAGSQKRLLEKSAKAKLCRRVTLKKRIELTWMIYLFPVGKAWI